ncbi:MAG: hypothetical protein DI585_07260 [Pseudomonas fluorescens]|nr:MAG: hypothetical protein DI585_07260 [Pseudomonas fluorescens]
MRTIKTPSTSLTLLLCALTLVGAAAHAQTGSGTSSRAQRLEWPRTFTGQPDFMFTRDEAIAESRTRAARENEPLPLTPSLGQLINDDTAFDPLRVNKPATTDDVSQTTTVDASGTVITTPASRQTLMDRLMAEAVDLPAVASGTQPDLSEFRSQLTSTISRTIAGWQPQQGRYSFESVLNTLVLQAIVTSPVKYAVINQQRYVEGETFRISVPLPVPDAEITAALQTQMPISGTLPAALQANYELTYNDVLTRFNNARNAKPEIGTQTLIVPVKIMAIEPRRVMLEMGGQSYALGIRYAY